MLPVHARRTDASNNPSLHAQHLHGCRADVPAGQSKRVPLMHSWYQRAQFADGIRV